MAEIRHPEFDRELENTSYPFVPSATLSNGTVNFLEGTFLDAHLYSVLGTSNYYISQVNVEATKVTITIADASEESLLTGEVSLPVQDGNVYLKDVYERPAGILVSEVSRLSLLSGWGIGLQEFTAEETEFAVTCCMPIPNPGVTAIRLEDGSLTSGKIWILGQEGCVLKASLQTDKAGNPFDVLELHAVGDPLFLQKLCDPEDLFSTIQPLTTLEIYQVDSADTETLVYTCDADSGGNFNVQMNDSEAPDTALRIRTTPEGIVVQVEGTSTVGN